jgi:hypothetical protein
MPGVMSAAFEGLAHPPTALPIPSNAEIAIAIFRQSLAGMNSEERSATATALGITPAALDAMGNASAAPSAKDIAAAQRALSCSSGKLCKNFLVDHHDIKGNLTWDAAGQALCPEGSFC